MPSLEAIERRRFELWILGVVFLGTLMFGLVLALPSVWASLPEPFGWVTPEVVRAGMVMVTVTFSAYVVEKGLALRRLRRLLSAERDKSARLGARLEDVSALLAMGRDVNSEPRLGELLDLVLSSALRLVHADEGSIMLVDGPAHLRVARVHGDRAPLDKRVPIAWGVAGRVALTMEPLLLSGRADPTRFTNLIDRDGTGTAICVPLAVGGRLLGVMNVFSHMEHAFSEDDLEATVRFAEQASMAVANAQEHEAERRRFDGLLPPLTSILGSVSRLRTSELDQDQQGELLDGIERQGRRLLRLIEEYQPLA